ncbi:hypothetical protein [Streptomyces sp. NPDC051016]|uniref:hypothetical protein n=1 Tax=Streptomyces sp. NPDC051016 TaxID=3365638 RepID=UPI0037AA45AB
MVTSMSASEERPAASSPALRIYSSVMPRFTSRIASIQATTAACQYSLAAARRRLYTRFRSAPRSGP